MIEEKKEANGAETTIYGEEPPPDPEDSAQLPLPAPL